MWKVPRDKAFMRDPATVNCRIYVGGLNESITEDMLKEHFGKHGNILGIVQQWNFGFIQFENEASAQEAIKNEHGSVLGGRNLNVKQAFDSNKNKPQKQNEDAPEQNQGNNMGNRPGPGPQDNHQGPGQPPRKIARRGGRGGMRGGHIGGMEREPYGDEGDYSYRDVPPHYGGMDKPYPPGGYMMPPERGPVVPERNDCEIIVVSKALTEYAEYIEQRLKSVGLTVDLLFPNEDVPIGRVLANISSRGCLYAILVMPQNEEHRSLTLNILHGLPQEHRNMPLEDAIALITRNFDAYMRGEKSNNLPNIKAPPLSERHPEPIQILLNLLADNRQLTTLQYDRIIKYLQEKRELQYKQELGDTESGMEKDENTKQAELQNRILSILNKTNNSNSSSTPESFSASVFSNPVSNTSFPLKTTNTQKSSAPTLLHDPSVQKALDSLMQGDLLKNITGGN